MNKAIDDEDDEKRELIIHDGYLENHYTSPSISRYHVMAVVRIVFLPSTPRGRFDFFFYHPSRVSPFKEKIIVMVEVIVSFAYL